MVLATYRFDSFIVVVSVVLSVCFVSFSLVYAQTNSIPVVSTTTATTTIATTTTTTGIPAIQAAASDWYTKETLTGNNTQTGDFVVGPGRLEVSVKPGESVTKMMTVTNRISDSRTFSLSVEDMSGSADGSGAVVLLGDQAGPYTLRDYISFGGKTLDLDLGERAQIPVTITMPINAEPGGYYGSVLVSTVRDEGSTEIETARSPIVARIGTLLFITVPGKAETGGELLELSTTNNQWWWQSGPINLGLLFENTGSVHLNPYGEIQVTNMFGEEVGFVELEPWFVLPKSLRLREVTWDRELLIGRYTITAKVNRGYDDVVDETSVAIWVVPYKVIAVVFGLLFTLFFLIRLFVRTFELKRKGS